MCCITPSSINIKYKAIESALSILEFYCFDVIAVFGVSGVVFVLSSFGFLDGLFFSTLFHFVWNTVIFSPCTEKELYYS